ncbi:MAG: hypothetical protein AB9869_24300 [Verrucomicrobiia bacterium]
MGRAEKFNARAYFLSTARWFNNWPSRAIAQFEAEGFTRIRLEQIEPHPVWHLVMRAPSVNLTSRQAGQVVRRIVQKEGTIPTGGFFCSIPRLGAVEAAFVLLL